MPGTMADMIDQPENRGPGVGPLAALRTIDARATPDLKWAVPSTALAVLMFGIGENQQWPAPGAAGVLSLFGYRIDLPGGWTRVFIVGIAVLFTVFGVVATRTIARELDRVSRAKAGPQAGSAIRLIVLIAGYLIVILGALAVLRVNLANLLVGGAITGVIIGIAAQQTLGNFFAGLVLLFARPYIPGQRVRVRSGAMGGPLDGVIVGAGLMYTQIETAEGLISMPNSGLLGAAIGPAPDEDEDEGADQAESDADTDVPATDHVDETTDGADSSRRQRR